MLPSRWHIRSRGESVAMPSTVSYPSSVGGRLSLDFANTNLTKTDLSWERLIQFLESTRIVSQERGAHLLSLPQSDHQAAEALLLKARRLGSALRKEIGRASCRERV